MLTKIRLCAVALVASGVFFFYAHQGWACHGGRGHHSHSQSPVVTSAQQPASPQQQAALVAKVQQTSDSVASLQQRASSGQGSAVPALQQKQAAVEDALQAALKRGNGRLTKPQLHALGRQESAIVAQLRAVPAGAVK